MGELGTRLRQQREARGLTIEDAERDTRISRRYLQALEAEQFEVIPAPVYARGFLRSYSQYLGLDPQATLALFPRDDDPAYNQAGATTRPSRDNPIPGTSASRPTWNRPRPTQPTTSPRTSQKPATATTPAATTFPGTRRETPPAVAETRLEPTIGIDIGVAVPARRLERDPAASTRTAGVILLAAAAIAIVLALAWLINRAGGDSAPPGDATAPAGTSSVGAAPSPTSGLPAVPRGVVPDVIGRSAADALQLIAAAGYQAAETRQKSPNVARGQVMDQSPAPGGQLAEGQVVRIQVSDGP